MSRTTSDPDETYAAVDSGHLLIIDPCYLTRLLKLSKEQEQIWRDIIERRLDSEEDIESVPVYHLAKGMLLHVDSDGIYSPEDVAYLLLQARPSHTQKEAS